MRFFFFSLVVISLVIVLVPSFIYLLSRLLGIVLHYRISYRPFGIVILGLVGLWLALAIYGNLFGRFRHEQKHIELQFATLPESFDGYNIVHISDLHLDGWSGHAGELQAIVDEVNALRPDAIVFTGDLVSLKEDELAEFIPVLRQLKARDGVFSIMGNHDYMPYNRSWSDQQRLQHITRLQDMERSMGWQLLLNQNAIIHRDGDSIAILGSENQSLGVHNVVMRGDLKKTMQGTDGLFRILLTHDPTHWRGEVLDKTDIPLTLSGHTHGGQMNIFGLFYVSTFVYKEHAGLYEENNQRLYVNIGLGGTMPMRVGATPEITSIKISRKQ